MKLLLVNGEVREVRVGGCVGGIRIKEITLNTVDVLAITKMAEYDPDAVIRYAQDQIVTAMALPDELIKGKADV